MKLAALTTLAVLAFAAPTFAAPENYTIDPNHTNIIWQVSHFGFSNPNGKFASATGTLVLDEAAAATSRVEVKLDLNGMVTGLPKFDEHIKGSDFLNVAQFPTATFVSTKVEQLSEQTARVTGNLTLHGITKPVTMNVRLNKIGVNPIISKKTAGFTALMVIKRSDFGISAYIPNVADEVKVAIEAEANRD